LGLFGGAEHPLELLGSHDGDHPVAAGALGRFQVGLDMVQFAVVPTGAVRLGQVRDWHRVCLGEGVDLAAEAVADLLDHRGGRYGLAEVPAELVDLPAHLQVRDVGVQVEAVDAGDVEPDVAVEHVVDVHHAGHA